MNDVVQQNGPFYAKWLMQVWIRLDAFDCICYAMLLV